MNNNDWEKLEEEKKIIEEVKAFVYTDIIGRLAKKGWGNLSSGEQLKMYHLITNLNTLDVKIDKYSRLGCQIELKKEYDNITVSIV